MYILPENTGPHSNYKIIGVCGGSWSRPHPPSGDIPAYRLLLNLADKINLKRSAALLNLSMY